MKIPGGEMSNHNEGLQYFRHLHRTFASPCQLITIEAFTPEQLQHPLLKHMTRFVLVVKGSPGTRPLNERSYIHIQSVDGSSYLEQPDTTT